jgi:sodium-dependent dicarboxylate transporter 2/3/5
LTSVLKQKWFRVIAGPVLGFLAYLLLSGLPLDQRIMAAIFVATVFYWVSEPVPLFVTSILAASATGLFLGPLAAHVGLEALDYRIFLSPFASPVVVLLFGGFVMAFVFSKNNLDLEFSQMILARVGSRPTVVLASMMVITALMSMWMSNTATTAIMVATALPLVRGLPADSKFTRALMLGIPFSANIGGIGTPIGTTPNAIAIGLMADAGVQIGFLEWMLFAIPIMALLLAFTFFLLKVSFPISRKSVDLQLGEKPVTAHRTLVYATFFVTVALWVTDTLHGIPSALIALVPVLVFGFTGVLKRRHLREISWDILLLIGGGIALGVGLKETGLAETIVAQILPTTLDPVVPVLILCVMGAFLATVMSNTAASNIVLPLAVTLAAAHPETAVIPVALCASFGMALPISTPPNAIAYGSGLIDPRDMFRGGTVVTVVGVVLVVVYSWVVVRLLSSIYLAAN